MDIKNGIVQWSCECLAGNMAPKEMKRNKH
jgi:hypothetical protein